MRVQRIGLAIILGLLGGLLLIGCGQSRFEFIVEDADGESVASVMIYYRLTGGLADSAITVGRTDENGRLVISGDHLATPRHYIFDAAGATRAYVFHSDHCAILSQTHSGTYTYRYRDGVVRRVDLEQNLAGRKWPGRRIRMTREPAEQDAETLPGPSQSLMRRLDLLSTPEASVKINGRRTGRTDEHGRLVCDFCPGDSGACFAPTAVLTIQKSGWAPLELELSMPPPLGTLQVEAELQAVDLAERVEARTEGWREQKDRREVPPHLERADSETSAGRADTHRARKADGDHMAGRQARLRDQATQEPTTSQERRQEFTDVSGTFRTYRDPSGVLSIPYPDSWSTNTETMQQTRAFVSWYTFNAYDAQTLASLEVFLFDVDDIWVCVSMMNDLAEAFGSFFAYDQPRNAVVDEWVGFVLPFGFQSPAYRARGELYLIPVQGRMYGISLAAPVQEYALVEPVFKRVLKGVRITAE